MHSISQIQKIESTVFVYKNGTVLFVFGICAMIYCKFTVCFRSVSSLMKSKLVTSMSTGEVVS